MATHRRRRWWHWSLTIRGYSFGPGRRWWREDA
jgi:hypothetical protein